MGMLHDMEMCVGEQRRPRVGRPRRDAVIELHGKMIWTAWTYMEGSECALIDRHGIRGGHQTDGLGLRADELSALRSGRHSLSESRCKQLIAYHPDLLPVLSWPMALLSEGVILGDALSKIMAPFLRDGSFFKTYQFPGDSEATRLALRATVSRHDRERLYERGDPFGFFALVETFRTKGLERDTDAQWFAARYMIKALPGLCRHPAAKPYSMDIIARTKFLLRMLPDTCWPIRINEEIIYRQIGSDSHEPSRLTRLEEKTLGNDIEAPEEPFFHHRLASCDEASEPILPSLA